MGIAVGKKLWVPSSTAKSMDSPASPRCSRILKRRNSPVNFGDLFFKGKRNFS